MADEAVLISEKLAQLPNITSFKPEPANDVCVMIPQLSMCFNQQQEGFCCPPAAGMACYKFLPGLLASDDLLEIKHVHAQAHCIDN